MASFHFLFLVPRRIGWRNAGLVWAWSICWFVINDAIKSCVNTVWDVVAADTTGRAFYRNIFAFGWDKDDAPADEREERVLALRESLRKFAGSQKVHDEYHHVSGSMSLGVGPGMAFLSGGGDDDEDRLVTTQDVILASETLQNDPQLMRLLSHAVHTIAKLEERIEKLEGRSHRRKPTLQDDSVFRTSKAGAAAGSIVLSTR